MKKASRCVAVILRRKDEEIPAVDFITFSVQSCKEITGATLQYLISTCGAVCIASNPNCCS
jgi:hypothetical protein